MSVLLYSANVSVFDEFLTEATHALKSSCDTDLAVKVIPAYPAPLISVSLPVYYPVELASKLSCVCIAAIA